MSTKLTLLSFQNSRCKYSLMTSEFQFKEPPCPRKYSKKLSIVVYGYFLELPNEGKEKIEIPQESLHNPLWN